MFFCSIFRKSKTSHSKQNKKKNKKEASTIVSPDNLFRTIPPCKKTFFTALRKGKKASLTLEAAFVVPFFLFVVCNLIQVINHFYQDADRITRMSENAKNFAIYMYAVDHLVDDSCLETLGFGDFQNNENCILLDDNIDLFDISVEKPMFIPFGFGEYLTINRATCHMWTGYRISEPGQEEEEEEGEYVYITPTGSVYHTFRDCRHINITIRSVAVAAISTETNNSGRHYTPCERCGGQPAGACYYVSTGGDRYHTNINCGSIKRTVMTVTLDEAVEQGRRLCQTCGGRQQ